MAILLVIALLVFGALQGSCSRAVSPSHSVLVSAAVSLTEVLEDVSEAYEEASGEQILLNLGSSNTIARQIVAGAPTDVFISADVRQMKRIEDAGRVDPRDRFDLLTNQLVVVVAPVVIGDPVSLKALLIPSIRRIAIGEPSAVPAGVYWREYLESNGLWEDFLPKLVPVSSVRAALMAVEHGTVEAAFVYRTDLFMASRSRLAFAIPYEEAPSIVYPAAILKQTRNRDAANRFLTYLRSSIGQKIFEKYEFGVLRREDKT